MHSLNICFIFVYVIALSALSYLSEAKNALL